MISRSTRDEPLKSGDPEMTGPRQIGGTMKVMKTVLKIAGKVLLAPFVLAALAILGVLWAVVKVLVGIYSFCGVFYIAIMILSVINVIVCYHDFKQIILFALAIGASTAILFVGATFQVFLEKAMKGMLSRMAII